MISIARDQIASVEHVRIYVDTIKPKILRDAHNNLKYKIMYFIIDLFSRSEINIK